MEIDYKIIAAALGLAGGFIGSVFSPLIKWDIEKRRLRRERRIQKVAQWRTEINSHTKFEDILHTETYSDLCHFMTSEEKKRFNAEWRSNYLGQVKEWEQGKFAKLHQVVSSVERKWKLV